MTQGLDSEKHCLQRTEAGVCMSEWKMSVMGGVCLG